jgi:hypothetical protein
MFVEIYSVGVIFVEHGGWNGFGTPVLVFSLVLRRISLDQEFLFRWRVAIRDEKVRRSRNDNSLYL